MFYISISSQKGFPSSSAGKESSCNAGYPGSIPGLGRSPGKGIGYPLQNSWALLVAQLAKNLISINFKIPFLNLVLCSWSGIVEKDRKYFNEMNARKCRIFKSIGCPLRTNVLWLVFGSILSLSIQLVNVSDVCALIVLNLISLPH